MKAQDNKVSRGQFGLRDVFLWTLVIGLACGWLADHGSNKREADAQYSMNALSIDRLQEGNEILRHYIERIGPPEQIRLSEVNATCSKCGIDSPARSQYETWFRWSDSWFCEPCAIKYGVDIRSFGDDEREAGDAHESNTASDQTTDQSAAPIVSD